jgi:hypothetical protein
MIRNIQCARSVQDVLVQTALPLSAEWSLVRANGIWNISTPFRKTLWR